MSGGRWVIDVSFRFLNLMFRKHYGDLVIAQLKPSQEFPFEDILETVLQGINNYDDGKKMMNSWQPTPTEEQDH